jgi:hypothetical protein
MRRRMLADVFEKPDSNLPGNLLSSTPLLPLHSSDPPPSPPPPLLSGARMPFTDNGVIMRNTSSQLAGPLFATNFYNPKPLTISQVTSRFSRLMVRSLGAARRPITQITAGSTHQVPSALQIQRENTSSYSHTHTSKHPPPARFCKLVV